MFNILYANPNDIQGIGAITKQAFRLYSNELDANIPVAALSETDADILRDIKSHHVLVAKSYGKILGCLRFEKLTQDLAYIYRFSVDPDEQNAGAGSILLDYALRECKNLGCKAVCLHTNTKYYKLARYYYGKQFYVHSTTDSKGYIRALFVKEFDSSINVDLSTAFQK